MLAPDQQRGLLNRVSIRLELGVDALADLCGVHPRTFRDWKRGKYKISDHALQPLCRKSGVPFPRASVVQDFSHTKKAGRLGALARYRLHGNLGTPEGRRLGGLRAQEHFRQNPEAAKRFGVVTAKEIKYPAHSPLLAEFVGVLIGDGGIRSRFQVTISFNRATETKYAQWLQRIIKRLFGLDSRLLSEKNNLGGAVLISSTKLVRYLKEIADLTPGNKLKHGLNVPSWIWERRSYKVACLRGLMDTDGSPFLHRYKVNGKWYSYPKLSFCSRSQLLRQSVVRLFRELGFHPRMARNDSVFVDRSAEAKRFFKVIGSRHKRCCD